MTNTTLSPGFYVGTRRTLRSFDFSLPRLSEGVKEDMSMEDFFSQLNSGRKVTTKVAPVTSEPSVTNEKSTSFSGWVRTSNARNLSEKAYAAPEIYQAAGGGDPQQAEMLVKAFKKQAAKVLSRCADTGETITQATADEINRYRSVVHEIRIVILHVSAQEIVGGRFDPKTNLWYREKTLRKFYLVQPPTDALLMSFNQEIADDDTNVTADRRLVAVRSDKVTPRTGRNAYTSSFRIVTQTSGFTEEDQRLLAACNRIRTRMNL